jgi:hypothetical protein
MIKIELAAAMVEARHPTFQLAPNLGRISRLSAYHGTKLELCSIIVVTTLSPSLGAADTKSGWLAVNC